MLNKHRVFNLAYALVFILVLATEYWHLTLLASIAKPCVPLLLIAFLCVTTNLSGRFHQRLFTGLIFSLTGSTLMMMHDHDPKYVLYGIIGFAIFHVFYISAFYLDFLSAKELDKKGARVAIVSCLIAFTGFYLYIRPHLPVMKLPALICIFIAALLVMMASFRNQRVNALSFKLILGGVVLLVITDALAAQVYFAGEFYSSGLLISAVYMLAQYLIISGGVERKLVHTQTPL